jgi:hypothetical protein
MHNFNRFALLVPIALMTGCAGTPVQITPPVQVSPEKPSATAPSPVRAKPHAAPSAPAAPPAIMSPALNETEVHAFVLKLLPIKLEDKEGWAGDLQSAFRSLQIRPTAENFCAVTAIIEQESSFQADPVVPGLPAIVRREIAQRSAKYSVPETVVDWMLSTTSRDGRSYSNRIAALRTEKELSDLIEEIIARIPAGRDLYPNYNPVHTGGPMQVSVEFAESHVRARPYPYPIHGNLRNEVFSRRGGIYFGSAILLDYPAPYADMLYRFADYNAGRYSSRNAAFQQALSRLSGKTLAMDGDLLRYRNGNISSEPSATLNALLTIKTNLRMNEAEIQRDLRLEKLASFGKTPLYDRLYALADPSGAQPRVVMPEIDLKSPKIRRKLTTEWFARRVYGRYKNCLQHSGLHAKNSAAKAKPATR